MCLDQGILQGISSETEWMWMIIQAISLTLIIFIQVNYNIILMIQPISFSCGIFSSFVLYKFSRVLYRIWPYLTRSSLMKDTSIKNEYVIIAGATDGVGKEYVRLLSKQYKVLGIGRNAKKLQEIKSINSNIEVFQIDFAEKSLIDPKYIEQSSKILQQIQKMPLKGIINCVGIANFSKYTSVSMHQIEKIDKTNINSLHFLLKLQQSAKQKQTTRPDTFFINLSSAVSTYPNKYSSIYAATKGYLSNLMQVIAEEDRSTIYLDLKPWYIKTKMVGNMQSWDTVHPQQFVQSSLRVLGKRSKACGSIKHELVEQFSFFTHGIIKKRIDEMMSRIQRMQNLRNKRK